MENRYYHSEEMLNRALKTIPLGTQTFSKSKAQFPYKVSPYFIKRGEGSHVWDIDGNEYIDFINCLAAITLGYNDEDVNRAVQAQLNEGIIFSLPHPIEVEVAEKVVEMVPCAEMVRFGKNGSDATSGAIRVARAYTNRDHIAVCGYHGWHDWYIGSTSRRMGVPKSTQELTHSFSYNDIGSLEDIFSKKPDSIAAVILEPTSVFEPTDHFLEKVKDLSHKYGAVLIFDETVTGFRLSEGGAQEYYGVTPDLATFGKGIANGYPLSVLAGKKKIMRLMEEVFYSFTFAGETLSLAASMAVMTKLQRLPIIETMRTKGQLIIDGVNDLIKRHNMEQIISISGNPVWTFLLIKDTPAYSQYELKTLFLQEVFAKGILTLGTHNMSYSHSSNDISKLLSVYGEVFPMMKEVVGNRNLEKYLKCDPLVPLFKVR